jgi:hypothetical protein
MSWEVLFACVLSRQIDRSICDSNASISFVVVVRGRLLGAALDRLTAGKCGALSQGMFSGPVRWQVLVAASSLSYGQPQYSTRQMLTSPTSRPMYATESRRVNGLKRSSAC